MTVLPANATVTIVGAGVVGSAIAYELSRVLDPAETPILVLEAQREKIGKRPVRLLVFSLSTSVGGDVDATFNYGRPVWHVMKPSFRVGGRNGGSDSLPAPRHYRNLYH